MKFNKFRRPIVAELEKRKREQTLTLTGTITRKLGFAQFQTRVVLFEWDHYTDPLHAAAEDADPADILQPDFFDDEMQYYTKKPEPEYYTSKDRWYVGFRNVELGYGIGHDSADSFKRDFITADIEVTLRCTVENHEDVIQNVDELPRREQIYNSPIETNRVSLPDQPDTPISERAYCYKPNYCDGDWIVNDRTTSEYDSPPEYAVKKDITEDVIRTLSKESGRLTYHTINGSMHTYADVGEFTALPDDSGFKP